MLIGMLLFCAVSQNNPTLNIVQLKGYQIVGDSAALLVQSVYTGREFIVDINLCKDLRNEEEK